jgi:NAD(P)H-nitrite reductase large subunit
MNENLMLCRCEEVTAPEVEVAIGEGATTLNDIKRRTRAGMGMCQGRWCSHALAALVAERTGQPMAALAPMTARPPVYPISLGVLADTEA